MEEREGEGERGSKGEGKTDDVPCFQRGPLGHCALCPSLS